MDKESFYAYAHEVIDKCFAIMEAADKEYASDADKFANFKWQGEAEGRTPEQIGITFMLKHVRSLSRGVSIREPMEGRICDIINYALLIGGMREEAAQATTTVSSFEWPPIYLGADRIEDNEEGC
mgnify:CR=1 FL=1